MNRSLIKILIGIWLAIAVVLTGFLAYAIHYNKSAGDVFSFFKWRDVSASTVQKDENISLDNFNKINVDFSSSDIIVQTTDEPNLRVIQKATSKLSEEEKFTINKENDNIIIKRGTFRSVFRIFDFGEKIEVYIPKTYTKDLDIQSSSGNVIFNSDIDLNNLSCTIGSGSLQSKGNVNVNVANLKANSGNISVKSLSSKSYKVNTSSSNIAVDSLSGSGDAAASSGNVKINYKDISEYSNVSSHSGDVDLVVPNGLSFQFNGRCSSGDIRSSFDLNYKNKKRNEATGQVGNGPYKKINASTNSGNIDISN
ncbi:DUF4097 family beta strand repeat-containing protein [Clostridium pasteurianum]|uniref:DUF4097 domain-containing protein n=1 Tax=Clostridium pasteurianum BC1 TaxID=86416 RepID=R4KCI1_CLOPA|nr:DUF4097 family beta strand repeat-containing protein [Clostridium pasteurianum]AGK99391.1 hypothetical protein Clopa_4703 [Clostridium pasteurianum BC1]